MSFIEEISRVGQQHGQAALQGLIHGGNDFALQRKPPSRPHKLVVDNFAGGGGTSTGLEIGLGRLVDVAINHNELAVAMHKLNHPQTKHYCEDVWHVNPYEVANGQDVGLVWLSPDCTHHSQAAGGQPRDNVIRGLAWVGRKWAGTVLPDVIMLENVIQILQWGPLVAKRDKDTGRVVKLDKTVAAPGERVKVQDQYLIPDKKHKGRTWNAFVRSLEALGYVVEHRKLCAADYGAPTTRERLFMVARRDGKPIVWPEPTHAKNPTGDLKEWEVFENNGKKKSILKAKKWRAASECIDWSIPCPSIFKRKRELAAATLRRVARGIQRYVLDSGDPFIVPIAHYNGSTMVHDIKDPFRTIMAATKGGEFALAAPVLAKFRGDSIGTRVDEPVPVITSGGNSKRPAGSPHALGIVTPIMVQAGYMMQANGGFNTTPGHELTGPMSTITNTGSQQQLITANLVTLRNCCVGSDVGKEPVSTITSNGQHQAVVTALLSSYYTDDSNRCRSMDGPTATITTENRLGLIAASMVQTGYGEREGQKPRSLDLKAPLGTIVAGACKHAVIEAQLEYRLTAEEEMGALRVAHFMFRHSEDKRAWDDLPLVERLALVTVNVKGVPHVIVDIGLRMMAPRELYTAQGFPTSYVIDHGAGGIIFSKSTQVKLVGNSVSPVIPAALARANCADMVVVPDMTIDNWEMVA